MSKQVILHLGRPKTGTTAIQAFLRLNKGLLEANDIRYVGNLAPIAAPFPDYARFIQATSAEEYKEAIIKMRNLIASSKQSTFVYSNEIHYGSHKVLKAYKASVGPLPLTVILYLRRQDEDLQAQYMQRVVDPDVRETRDIGALERENLNLLKLLADYDSIFGKYKLVTRIYAKSSFLEGNIFKDFFHAAGFNFPENAQYPDKSTSNLSRGRLYIEILRLANQRRPPASHLKNMLEIDRYLGDSAFKDYGSGYGFLTQAEKRAIMDECSSTNAEVAQKYFDREDGILFEEAPEIELESQQQANDRADIQSEACRLYDLIFPE
jgi:hypothetical protein